LLCQGYNLHQLPDAVGITGPVRQNDGVWGKMIEQTLGDLTVSFGRAWAVGLTLIWQCEKSRQNVPNNLN
jgi:hypothetical protein